MYKFNPATGLIHFVPDNNFAFKKVEMASLIVIPSNQQMMVIDGIEIEGSLDIEGELCLIS